MLTQDLVLGQYVTNRLSITHRKSNSLRDLLVSSHLSDVNTSNSDEQSTIPCGTCAYCQYLDTRTTAIQLGGVSWRAHHHVTCNTQGVVYLLKCPCNAFYVGKTCREFWGRIGRHIALEHNYKFEGFAFFPLCIITHDSRGEAIGTNVYYRQRPNGFSALMLAHLQVSTMTFHLDPSSNHLSLDFLFSFLPFFFPHSSCCSICLFPLICICQCMYCI